MITKYMNHESSRIQPQRRQVQIQRKNEGNVRKPQKSEDKIGLEKKIKEGQRFGRLTAIRFIEKRFRSHEIWEFKCDCGSLKNLFVNNVKRNTKSCGCLKHECLIQRNKEKLSTHKLTNTSIHRAWASMKSRCLNKNHKSYPLYGGRGINVCNRWMIFENFYQDMGERPSKNHSLDRVDNNGDYTPENCRWADRYQQQSNRRTNHYITFSGETMTIAQWSRKLQINTKTLATRILTLKWSYEDALTTPILKT